MHRKQKRMSWGIVAMLIAISLLAACSSSEPEVVKETVIETVIQKETVVETVIQKETVVEEVIVAATETPKGGDLAFAVRSEFSTLDPNVHASWVSAQLIKNLFDPLILVDAEGNLHPALAESWEVADDNTWMEFHLRDDVTFHDGTPFNAEALKFNLDRIADPATESLGAVSFLGPYDRTEVLDDYTARVYWKESFPFLSFINIQQGTYFMMNSPTAVEEYGEDYGTAAVVGTGPYTFKEWVLGDHATVVKNPDYAWASSYYDHDQPYLDSITAIFVPEGGTRAAVLETGEVDMVFELPPEWVGRVATDPALDVIKGDLAGPGVMYVQSVVNPMSEDIRVRQAIEYAIDRDGINATVYGGLATMQSGPLSYVTPCFDEASASKYDFDLEKARALLAEAGWTDSDGDGIVEKDGQPFNDYTIWSFDPRLGEILQAQIKEIGIDADTIAITGGPLRMEKARAGDYGLMVLAWRSLDPGILRTLWHSEQIGAWNFSMLVDPELDALLDEGQTIGNMDERCELYNQAQDIIMEQGIMIPINAALQLIGHSSNLKGLEPDWSKDNGVQYFDAYIEE